MKKSVKILFVLLFALSASNVVFSQNLDSLKKIKISTAGHQDLTFTGTKITQHQTDYDTTGHFVFGGYVSAYYAFYTDSAGPNNYQKFPTVSPQSNAFGLNIAQLSAKYNSNKFRGNITFHYGDIPESAWSPKFNLLQEANVGVRIVNKLWLDAGFFRTHIGLESIQPRENIASSLASTTYFEPYYMSGAKLTYNATSKLTLQINAFNSFNGFVETNNSKAFGLSVLYEANKNFSLTFNSITSDESVNLSQKHQRLYNNLYAVYKHNRLSMGAELNYGIQQNSNLSDSSKAAFMYSGLIAAKYRVSNVFNVFGRFEFFEDNDELLTGPVVNSNHQLVGLNILGYTGGVEIKLIPNSYLRFEYRYLQTASNEKVFYYNHKFLNVRNEAQVTLGVWF